MRIVINPTSEEEGSGLTSSVTWEYLEVVSALNAIFRIRKGESIGQLEVDKNGITARIKTGE